MYERLPFSSWIEKMECIAMLIWRYHLCFEYLGLGISVIAGNIDCGASAKWYNKITYFSCNVERKIGRRNLRKRYSSSRYCCVQLSHPIPEFLRHVIRNRAIF